MTGDIIGLALNDRAQVAVWVTAVLFPFDPDCGPAGGPDAILCWQNGSRTAVVGPGDLIPGGSVGVYTALVGLSNNGRLAFETTVTDDQGVSRDRIFVALEPGEG